MIARVYQRGKRWYADYTNHKGKRVRAAIVNAGTEKEAQRALYRILDDEDMIRRGRIDPLSNDALIEPLLGAFLLHHAGRFYQTARFYAQALTDAIGVFKTANGFVWPPRNEVPMEELARKKRTFMPGALGVRQVNEITPELLEHYVSERRGQLSPRTLAHRIKAVKALLNWACDVGRIRVNPVAKVKPPRKVWSRARALDVPDYERLVAASPEPWQTLWATLGSTGMRIGECLKLRWPQVNWPTRTIRVLPETSKSRKQRDVPMTADTHARLRLLYERAREGTGGAEPKGVVFATREGKERGNNVRRAFLKCLKRAGLESCGFTIHSLRHTFATSLLRMGANPKVVSELLGHATIRVTLDVYGHVFPADTYAAVDLLPYGRGTVVAQCNEAQLQHTGA